MARSLSESGDCELLYLGDQLVLTGLVRVSEAHDLEGQCRQVPDWACPKEAGLSRRGFARPRGTGHIPNVSII